MKSSSPCPLPCCKGEVINTHTASHNGIRLPVCFTGRECHPAWTRLWIPADLRPHLTPFIPSYTTLGTYRPPIPTPTPWKNVTTPSYSTCTDPWITFTSYYPSPLLDPRPLDPSVPVCVPYTPRTPSIDGLTSCQSRTNLVVTDPTSPSSTETCDDLIYFYFKVTS